MMLWDVEKTVESWSIALSALMEFEVTIGSAEYQVSLQMHWDRLSKTITAD
jgi:hypothetical protein